MKAEPPATTPDDMAPASPEDQDRLARILDDYLQAAERGAPQSRAALLARHPHDASRLARLLSGLDLLRHAAQAEQVSEPACVAPPKRPGQTLGDYELVRELGRGGMGIVYEAVDVVLRRRVALKVLPAIATRQPKQLARFRNEAQAAAQIQHPHIVPVYAVGSAEGLHYYAMQLVEGASLASLLDDATGSTTTRALAGAETATGRSAPPEFGDRAAAPSRDDVGPAVVARLGVEHVRRVAAWGVQAAEALHAAHEFGVVHRDVKPSNLLVDRHGKLWVTDFGLARWRDADDLTQTGDVLGTMRYMSPEQAAGRGEAIVDHRTDIFSLGVTLYELAAGAHPAAGLGAAAFDRARWRRALRQLNPAAPADFETIVLKAMAETPNDRYPTAQAVADDLARFLAGRPIVASRPSLWSCAAKWARRHQAAVAAGAAVLVAGFIGLALSVVLVNRAYRQEASARATAETRFRFSRDVVERLGALGDQLAPIPAAASVRRQLYDYSLDYFRQLAAETGDRSLDAEMALAQTRVGAFTARMGDAAEALRALETAEVQLARLVAAEPGRTDYVRSLAQCRNRAGLLLLELQRARDALRMLRGAERLLADAAGDAPSGAIAVELAATACNVAAAQAQTGDRAGAARRLNESIAALRTALAQSPHDETVARTLASGLNSLAALDDRTNRPQAIAHYREAARIQTRLAADHPFDHAYQSDLARTYNNLGFVHSLGRAWRDAAESYGKSIALQENLVRASHEAPFYCRELAVSWNNLGAAQNRIGRPESAVESFTRAVDAERRALAAQPGEVRTLSDLGGVYSNLGAALQQLRRDDEARSAYRSAIDVQQQALAQAPTNDAVRVLLDRHYAQYAHCLARQRRWSDALAATLARKALGPADAAHLQSVARDLVALPAAPPSAREGREARLSAAVATLAEAVAAGLDVAVLKEQAWRPLQGRRDFRALLAARP